MSYKGYSRRRRHLCACPRIRQSRPYYPLPSHREQTSNLCMDTSWHFSSCLWIQHSYCLRLDLCMQPDCKGMELFYHRGLLRQPQRLVYRNGSYKYRHRYCSDFGSCTARSGSSNAPDSKIRTSPYVRCWLRVSFHNLLCSCLGQSH